MRVVIANPGEAAYAATIEGDLASLQSVVGGWIKLWAVDGHAWFLCHEEGRINGLPFNRVVTLSDGTMWDIYGPIVVVGGHDEDGIVTFESLTDDELAEWTARLNPPPAVLPAAFVGEDWGAS